jgi:hypothetical protein
VFSEEFHHVVTLALHRMEHATARTEVMLGLRSRCAPYSIAAKLVRVAKLTPYFDVSQALFCSSKTDALPRVLPPQSREQNTSFPYPT